MNSRCYINRPPRDGHMAFIRSPDNISIELLQKGDALTKARTLGFYGKYRSLVRKKVAPPRRIELLFQE